MTDIKERVIELDRKYLLHELKQMAKEAGLSPAGTKHEIAGRLIRSTKVDIKTYVVTIETPLHLMSTSSGRTHIRRRISELKRRVLAIDPDAEVEMGPATSTDEVVMYVKTSRLLTHKMIDKRRHLGIPLGHVGVRQTGLHADVRQIG